MSHTVRDRRRGGGWHDKLDGVAWRGGWYSKLDGTAISTARRGVTWRMARSSAARRGGHCGEIDVAVKEQQRGLDRDES